MLKFYPTVLRTLLLHFFSQVLSFFLALGKGNGGSGTSLVLLTLKNLLHVYLNLLQDSLYLENK
jgi:hypothetical protein